MKLKKITALVTAIALAMLPVSTAFAEGDQSDLTGASNTSDATIDYIDASKVVTITVPTNLSLGFTLDPQNLAATQGVNTWQPASGGAIIPQAVVTVVNRSAVPIKTTVNFSVSDDAANKTILFDAPDNINTGTDKNMYLTVTPASKKTAVSAAAIGITTVPTFYQQSGSDVEFTEAELTAAEVPAEKILTDAASSGAIFGDFICTDDSATDKTYKQVIVPVIAATKAAITATTVSEYNATSNGYGDATDKVTVTSGGAILAYVMDKANYFVSKKVDGTFELIRQDGDTNTNYDTASYVIGGLINKNADWSDYTGASPKKLTLSATYTFKAMTEAKVAQQTALTDSHNSVVYVEPTTPTVVTTGAAITASTSSAITVSLGQGDAAADGITSVSISGSALTASDYTFATNKITLSSTYIDSLIAAGFTSGTFTVTFNDDDTTTGTFALSYSAQPTNVAASVVPTSVNYSKASGATVQVNLGSGTGHATGITTVATTASGTDYPWDAATWAFSGTTLTLKSTALISSSSGTKSIKVTFSTGATDTFDAVIVP